LDCGCLHGMRLWRWLWRGDCWCVRIKDDGGQSQAAEKNWVDQISGSFKDDPEFEEVLRYGREYRESPYPDYCQSEAQ
jgi:hypothetical protein